VVVVGSSVVLVVTSVVLVVVVGSSVLDVLLDVVVVGSSVVDVLLDVVVVVGSAVVEVVLDVDVVVVGASVVDVLLDVVLVVGSAVVEVVVVVVVTVVDDVEVVVVDVVEVGSVVVVLDVEVGAVDVVTLVVVVVDPPVVVLVVDDDVVVDVVDVDVVLGGALEVVELLVVAGGRLVEVVVGCGGQLPNRGPHTRMKRSRSVRRPARAETRTGMVPGRWRRSGPRTGTVRSTGGPHPGPASDAGGTRSATGVRSRSSAGGGMHPTRSGWLTQSRTSNRHVPSHMPSWSQRGSPSTQVIRRPPRAGSVPSTSRTARQSLRRGPPPGSTRAELRRGTSEATSAAASVAPRHQPRGLTARAITCGEMGGRARRRQYAFRTTRQAAGVFASIPLGKGA
jgi:hypothetical protein